MGVWGASSPNSKSREECNSEGPETTGIGESVHHGRLQAYTHSPEEGECLNLWVQGATGELGWRLPECWLGTEKSWARPPELATAKKTSKSGLVSLKPTGGFFF